MNKLSPNFISMFNNSDSSVLREAIKWKRYREGSFSSSDPLLAIKGKLKSITKLDNTPINFTPNDIVLLINTVEDNIKFMRKYPYDGLTKNQAEERRNSILNPLIEVHKKLLDL